MSTRKRLLIALAAVLVAAAVLAAWRGTVAWREHGDATRNAEVAAAAEKIMAGVQGWAVDHNDNFPGITVVTKAGLKRSMKRWPINPFTGEPMHPGTGPGDYVYTSFPYPTGYNGGFRLVAYGAGGKVVYTIGMELDAAAGWGESGIWDAVHDWGAAHGHRYPPASFVTAEGLGGEPEYLDDGFGHWPRNPFTGEPMQLGSGPGDYRYMRLDGSRRFRLFVYGEDGKPLHL